MDWTTKLYGDANHLPMLAHPARLTVKLGEEFHLNADGTHDPAGNSMSYLWFQYPEVGTYSDIVSFRCYASNLYDLPITAPVVDSAKTIYFILKVTHTRQP